MSNSAKEMLDNDFINFQDDFYNLLEKYGVSKIDIEHPEFKSICSLRNKVAEFIEQETIKMPDFTKAINIDAINALSDKDLKKVSDILDKINY